MKPLFAASLALLVALPLSAAPAKAPKAKTRTLQDLTEIAMADGKVFDCPENVLPELAFSAESLTEGKLPSKSVSFKQKISPDRKKHIFSVAYKHDFSSGKDTPIALVWDVFAARKEGDTPYAEGYTLRVSLDGRLENAVSIKGPLKDGKHTVLPIDSAVVKNVFQHEVSFYTRDSLGLEMSK